MDALHAHFAEWVRFLDAKGQELEAQLAKLEAKKARSYMSLYQLALHRQIYWKPQGEEDFLDIVFRSQAHRTPDARRVGSISSRTRTWWKRLSLYMSC